MAHKIDFSKGFAAAWNRNEESWHGLGSQLDTNDSSTIIKEAGLDWEVIKTPITTTYNGVEIPIPNVYSTTRTDTNVSLGVVGKNYQVFQNEKMFEFFDALGSQGAEYSTAGSLKKGSIVYISAKAGSVKINGDSDRDNYLVITNSHDGTSQLRVYLSSIRPVCWNTLSAGLKMSKNKAGEYVSVKHTGNYKDKLEEAKRILGLASRVFEEQKEFLETARKLVLADDVTKELALKLLCDQAEWETLATGASINDVLSTRKQNQYLKLVDCIFSPDSQQNILGSGLALIEGVTYFTSHVKDKEDKEDTMYNTYFGSSLTLQQKTVDLVAAMI